MRPPASSGIRLSSTVVQRWQSDLFTWRRHDVPLGNHPPACRSGMGVKSFVAYFADIRRVHGTAAMFNAVVHNLINRAIFFECFHIVVLDRRCVGRLTLADPKAFTSRPATSEEVRAMRRQPQWEVNDRLLEAMDAGDTCVLSFVNGTAAGYTWAHLEGEPEITPGLSISVPRDYIYSYAGLTLPEFRGLGLQSYRHHSILGTRQWLDRKGLISCVRAVNFASRNGQAKSGFRKVGSMWVIRWRGRYRTLFSAALSRLGIRRIHSTDRHRSDDAAARSTC
jgi:hypothetical protein